MAHRWEIGLAFLCGFVAVIPAEGAGPARNGLIVYAGAVIENVQPEIYAFPLDGGSRQNISRFSGRDVGPVLSPDGTKIVFRRGESDFVLARADGSNQRPLAVARSWSPDSRYVVGARGDGSGIDVIVTDTETLATKWVAPGYQPQWSPRDATVAYAGMADGLYVAALDGQPVRLVAERVEQFRWAPDGAKIAYLRQSRLAVVEIATGKTTELTPTAYGQITWSPDGERIYVRSPEGWVYVPSDGGAVRPFARADDLAIAPSGAHVAIMLAGRLSLTTPDGAVVRELGAGVNPSWSPSGRRLAFVRNDEGSIHVADVATGTVRVIADGKADHVAWRADVPGGRLVWRPDESAVITSSVVGAVHHDLFVTGSDGRGARLLRRFGADADDPAWSPDGSSIALTSYGKTPTIMVGDDRLRRLRVLAERGSEPAWSPDGSQIAYVGGSKPRWTLSPFVGSGIFVVGADGRGRRRITRGKDWSPAWSPDGTTLAFARSTGNDGSALYLLKLGAGRARPIFDAGAVGMNGESGEVVSISWSPEGSRIAFRLTSFVPEKYYSPEEDEVVVVDTRGKVVSRMRAGTSVTWSPDGRFLLHGSDVDLSTSSFRPRIDTFSLRVTRPDGRAARWLELPQRASSPSWQPLCTRSGSARADTIRGGAGPELLCGLGGADALTGGEGRDRIFGQAGNDAIDARDGTLDVIGCGPGRDTVRADRHDLVGVDCERVTRA